jgi:hypothetical protein
MHHDVPLVRIKQNGNNEEYKAYRRPVPLELLSIREMEEVIPLELLSIQEMDAFISRFLHSRALDNVTIHGLFGVFVQGQEAEVARQNVVERRTSLLQVDGSTNSSTRGLPLDIYL